MPSLKTLGMTGWIINKYFLTYLIVLLIVCSNLPLVLIFIS
jgi:hypothetical protein